MPTVANDPYARQGHALSVVGTPSAHGAAVSGLGDITDFFVGVSPVGMAAKETGVWGTALAGVGVGMAGKVAGLTGTARNVTGLASLGLLGFAAVNFVIQYRQISEELKNAGAAAVGPATVKGVMSDVNTVLKDGAAATDSAKKGVLLQFSCYENARRTDTWWGRLRGTARDPLKDCGMTSAQAALLKDAFSKISKPDRQRLGGAIYKPGGSLEDLG